MIGVSSGLLEKCVRDNKMTDGKKAPSGRSSKDPKMQIQTTLLTQEVATISLLSSARRCAASRTVRSSLQTLV